MIASEAATVCVPWRPQPNRIRAWQRVETWWATHGFKVIAADSDDRYPFNISQARNNAVRQADSKVVIVSDADFIPDIEAIEQATRSVDGVILPYDQYRLLSPEHVAADDLSQVQPIRVSDLSEGGCLVCRRETYWRLGGFDEQFLGWGSEDKAFACVARTLSTLTRLPYVAYGFDQASDRVQSRDNRARAELYRQCEGRPTLMRELRFGTCVT